MIGIKEIKACKLETDPTKFCLVLTVFYPIMKPCCEELLDSERSALERSLSGTSLSVSVITDEALRYYQDHECPVSVITDEALRYYQDHERPYSYDLPLT